MATHVEATLVRQPGGWQNNRVKQDVFDLAALRQVLRARCPTPQLYLHPTDASREQLADGDWVRLESATGSVTAQISIQQSMKEGHIRVPHGWWYPETRGQENLAGAFVSSDAVLCSDDDEFLDYEQGVPHFKGFPGRIVKTAAPDMLTAGDTRSTV